MKNIEQWRPTKYVMRNGRLCGSRDSSELSVGSRLCADLIASDYERLLSEHAHGSLLDMGCGKVPLFAAYRSYVTGVQCIDWGSSLHGTNFLDMECDLGGVIPYDDGSFDTIILSDVLEHLPEPMSCWREMARLLAPGGKVIMNVPFYYQVHEAPHDFYRYTEFALRRFVEVSGLEVVEIKPIGGALEILADLTAKLLAGVRLNFVASAIQSVALSFAGSRMGARIARRTSKRFPFGYFLVAQKLARR